jgi:hypothetical protein
MPSKKSESIKQAVVSKRLSGESKRRIAQDLEINRATVDNILDESNVEAALAQWRRDYMELVPKALTVVRKYITSGAASEEVDKEAFAGALQVLKGTGVHEERTRSRNDVRVSHDLSTESDEQLIDGIGQLLKGHQPQKSD